MEEVIKREEWNRMQDIPTDVLLQMEDPGTCSSYFSSHWVMAGMQARPFYNTLSSLRHYCSECSNDKVPLLRSISTLAGDSYIDVGQ